MLLDINEKINPMKELREYLGMTQQEFAEKASISKSTVMKIEAGEMELSGYINNTVKGKFSLNDDWYQERDYHKKVDISSAEENIIEYIKKSTYYEHGARTMYFALKEAFDTTGLTDEERETYITYIYRIIKDIEYISRDAKTYLKKKLFVATTDNAHKIANDVMSLFEDEVNNKAKLPGIIDIDIADDIEQKLDFS